MAFNHVYNFVSLDVKPLVAASNPNKVSSNEVIAAGTPLLKYTGVLIPPFAMGS